MQHQAQDDAGDRSSMSNNNTSSSNHDTEIYYRGKYCLILYERQTNIGVIEWLDYNPSNLFREASEKLIQLVAERRIAKLINNTEQLKIIAASEQQWVSTDFLPRLIQCGIQFIAMVNSLHYFTRIGAGNITQQFDRSKGVLIEYFNTKENARDWLLNQKLN